jgi:hypothetical protein
MAGRGWPDFLLSKKRGAALRADIIADFEEK